MPVDIRRLMMFLLMPVAGPRADTHRHSKPSETDGTRSQVRVAGSVVLLLGVALFAHDAYGQTHYLSSPRELLATDPRAFAEWLKTNRPTPLSAAQKANILDSLPRQGETTSTAGIALAATVIGGITWVEAQSEKNAADDRNAAPPCLSTTQKEDLSQGLCAPSIRLLREGRILGTTSLVIRSLLSLAIQEAARRLRGPECRRVLSDFTDASKRRLETNLIKVAVDPGDYVLDHVWFVDGRHKWQCSGTVAAFTQPGSRVIFVCGALFEWGNRLVRGAELMIIHEILHSLGLGENPPSSDGISKQVMKRCGPESTQLLNDARSPAKVRDKEAVLNFSPHKEDRCGAARSWLPCIRRFAPPGETLCTKSMPRTYLTLDQRREFAREAAAWIGMAGHAAEAQLAPLPLPVAIYDYAALPPPVLERAKDVATKIYGRIGVSLTWREDSQGTAAGPTNPAACPDSPPPLIHLRLLGRSPNQRRPTGDLGFASSGGTLASVLVERVKYVAKSKSQDVGDLLGVIMAHEIGHLLLPPESHSAGIMAPKVDLFLIDHGGPSFDRRQASLIRERIASMPRTELGACRGEVRVHHTARARQHLSSS